jgi:hypothetical protein
MIFSRRILGKIFFAVLCVGVLAAVSMPGVSQASYSQAYMGTISITAVDATGAPVALNWFDQGFSTQASQVGATFALNDTYVDPYFASFFDGVAWGNVSLGDLPGSVGDSITLTDGNITAMATAYTNVDGTKPYAVFSGADVNSTGVGFGSLFTQSNFTGYFTVPTDAYLTVTALYGLAGSGQFYADAGLVLSDFNGYDPATGQSPVLISDIRSLPGIGPASGTLSISNYLLTAGFVYDFEAGTTATAAVPEPMTLLFLAGTMLGLGAFARKFV